MIKEKFKYWSLISSKLGYMFAKLPFSPNTYTWSMIPFACFGLVAFSKGQIITGSILFLLAGLVDLIDGAVAREKQQSSNWGAFLDGSLDRFVDFLLLFSYFRLPLKTILLPVEQWIGLAIFLVIMPTFEVAYANHRKSVYDPDEKILWRLLHRGEMYFLMLLIPIVSIYSVSIAGFLLIILVIFSFITTLQTIISTFIWSTRSKIVSNEED